MREWMERIFSSGNLPKVDTASERVTSETPQEAKRFPPLTKASPVLLPLAMSIRCRARRSFGLMAFVSRDICDAQDSTDQLAASHLNCELMDEVLLRLRLGRRGWGIGSHHGGVSDRHSRSSASNRLTAAEITEEKRSSLLEDITGDRVTPQTPRRFMA